MGIVPMNSAISVKDVESACMAELVKLGFKKRKTGILTFPVNEELDGWVGLNSEVQFRDGSIAINPFIGVRYNRLHKLIAELEGEKYHPYMPPTTVKNIGYLTSDRSFKQYVFAPESDLQNSVGEMALDIERYGRPHFQALTEMRNLEQEIEKSCTWEDKSKRLLAIMLIRNCELSLMKEFIKERLSDLKAPKPSIVRFDLFSQKAIAWKR